MYVVRDGDVEYVVKATVIEFLDAFYNCPNGFTRIVTRDNQKIHVQMLAFLNERALEAMNDL